MNNSLLKNKAREMLKTRFSNMEQLNMENSKLDVLKSDFSSQLKALVPGTTDADITSLINELDSEGCIKLITNDMITFSKKIL